MVSYRLVNRYPGHACWTDWGMIKQAGDILLALFILQGKESKSLYTPLIYQNGVS